MSGSRAGKHTAHENEFCCLPDAESSPLIPLGSQSEFDQLCAPDGFHSAQGDVASKPVLRGLNGKWIGRLLDHLKNSFQPAVIIWNSGPDDPGSLAIRKETDSLRAKPKGVAFPGSGFQSASQLIQARCRNIPHEPKRQMQLPLVRPTNGGTLCGFAQLVLNCREIFANRSGNQQGYKKPPVLILSGLLAHERIRAGVLPAPRAAAGTTPLARDSLPSPLSPRECVRGGCCQ